MQQGQQSRSYNLGAILPKIALLVVLLDLALRLMPTEAFTFRAWEALRRFPAPAAPFEASRSYYNGQTYGDLAVLGNLPELREYRPERFTTDAYGYRNPPDLLNSPIAAILAGSSFSVGEGLDDEQTLSAQLRAETGQGVYNAATNFSEISVDRVEAVAQRIDLQRGLVILEYLERYDLPPAGEENACQLLGSPGLLQRGCIGLNGLLQVSPLQILAQRGYKALQNDTILPNVHAQRVVRQRLRNGDELLFLPEDLEKHVMPRKEEQAVEYFSRFAERLRRRNLSLLVVLVPTKYTVYQPLLDGQLDPGVDSLYLERLERNLRAVELPVLNLAPTFRTQAAADLDRRSYLYWRDDSHWNPRGIALASAEIRRFWRP